MVYRKITISVNCSFFGQLRIDMPAAERALFTKYPDIKDSGDSLIYIHYERDLGCILLGLFWLFLFRFRNNRIHGISISKRTLLHVSDLDRYFHSNFFNRKPAETGAGGRVGFPAKNSPKEPVRCLFRVKRIPFILFIMLSGAE